MKARAATRRSLLAGAAGGAFLAALRPTALLAAQILTPAQTEGPFYPLTFPLDRDADLATVTGASQRAQGVIAHVAGRVLDRDGRPVRGARVEIWQCNAYGRYHHPGDRGAAPIDPGFQGYGETVSTDEGGYRFRTIRPVAYPGRTAHIHFAVTVPRGGKLVTQMYVEGEAGNARDMVLNGIRDPEARKSVIVPFARDDATEQGAQSARFDIVLGVTAQPG